MGWKELSKTIPDNVKKTLINVLMPKMLVAGFVTVTIVSVFVGSIVLSLFF